MSKIADAEANVTSLDGLVNDNALVPTLRNGPKPSYQYLVDGWNAEIAEAILEMQKSRGFRVVGAFVDGFTYELFNDVGIDAEGNIWIYVGTGAPNKVVAAGTVPSVGAGYEQVTFNDASGVINANGGSVQDFIDSFELKVFQSSTASNTTLIESYTKQPSQVFEVRKASDDTLATIYRDEAGTIEIAQNGTANKSDSSGHVLFYISDGVYYISTGVNQKGFSTKELIPFNKGSHNIITCIPRISAAGEISFVDDVDHETLGFSSVERVGDFIMRVNYSETYSQVNNLSITIDDELCKYGVFTGGSVGVSYTDFTAYTQLRGVVDTTDMTFKSTGLLPDGNVNVSYVDDALIVDHDNAAFNTDAVVVTQQYGLSFMTNFGVGQSSSQINIIPYTSFSGALIYNGTDFVLDPAKQSAISTTQAGITYEWDATVNALKVTHPLAQENIVFVQAEKNGYTEYNVEVNSLTSFRVYFFNSSGGQITSPNANMSIMFSRPSCQVRGKIPTGAKFNLRAGIIPIRSSALGAAAGNNFWVSGVMQKD